MLDAAEFIDRLRVWSRRYEPRSVERQLMVEAADRLDAAYERLSNRSDSVEFSEECDIKLTSDMVERAMGAKLFPWQRAKLDAPPSKAEGK